MLTINKITKELQDKTRKVLLFEDFNLSLKKGEFLSIIGDNGIGKTTLLDIIAGIKKPDKGKIMIDNSPINNFIVGYVFQSYRQSLFPWINVIENISFPLKLRGQGKKERYSHVKSFCQKFGIEVNFYEYPNKLSGGQYQLVSIIRSIINDPDLMLMDEPFSSLDQNTSVKIQQQILNFSRELGITVIMISHRIDESIFLSSRIIVLGGCPVKIMDDFPNPLKYSRSIEDLSSIESNLIRKRIYGKL